MLNSRYLENIFMIWKGKYNDLKNFLKDLNKKQLTYQKLQCHFWTQKCIFIKTNTSKPLFTVKKLIVKAFYIASLNTYSP